MERWLACLAFGQVGLQDLANGCAGSIANLTETQSAVCTYDGAKCADLSAMLAYRRQFPPAEIVDLLDLDGAERKAKAAK